MNLSRFSTGSIIVLFLMSSFNCLSAQEVQTDKTYEPSFGEPGKDARWEPTPQILVDKMLDMAKVTSGDFLIDLGSGDGRIVLTAARRGVRARGIEFNQDMVELSRKKASDEGISNKAEFMQGDLFEADLSEATVITMYLLPRINRILRPRLLELKPGTRIVSNSHRMDDWLPDEAAMEIKVDDTFWNAYLWIIPAKVEGTWKMPQGELTLSQKFQMVSGTLKTRRNTITIYEGRLNGDQITFLADDARYSGSVNGNIIQGFVTKDGKSRKWSATRRGK
jgi:hypothetical protein